MLNTSDPAVLAEEVQRAEAYRRLHTARGAEVARRFVGNWYRNDQSCDPTPENLVSAYITQMLPRLAYSNPGVRVDAKRPVAHKAIAEWMLMGLKGLIKDLEFNEEHQDVVRDFLINFGVMKHGMEPRDSYWEGGQHQQSEALRPFACRMSPDDLILDPRCESPKYARFIGHKYWRDIDDIQAEAGERWDPLAVEQISGNGDEQNSGVEGSTERPLNLGQTGERKRVCLVDLWIRETGELITLGYAAGTALPIILRRIPYHGPKTGPYQIFGAYRVPGDPYPISPLQFAMEQFEEMQAHITAAGEAAETYKRFVLVDAANVDGQQAVLTAVNGSVVPIRGLSAGSIQQVELGGPHPEQLAYIQLARERFDRVMGTGDAQRGTAPDVTARAVLVAQNNTDERSEYLKLRVAICTGKSMEKLAWYLFHSPLVVQTVNWVDPQTGQHNEGLFLGGEQEGQQGISLDDFIITVIANSMSRPDTQKILQTGTTLLTLAPQALQMMMAMPAVNVRYIINMIGEGMEIQNLMDVLFQPQLLAQLGQLQMQQAAWSAGSLPPGMPPGGLPMGANPAMISAMGGAGQFPQLGALGGMGGGGGQPGFGSMGVSGMQPQAQPQPAAGPAPAYPGANPRRPAPSSSARPARRF